MGRNKSINQIFIRSLCILALLSLNIVACSKKQTTQGDGEATGVYDVNQEDIKSGRADSDSNNAMGLQTVHFPFDSSELTKDAQAAIQNNYSILKGNPDLKVQIEGHCDERGGIQYNLALGERRANAIKRKLSAMGIPGARIETISFGKEKPVALGHTETDFAQNRRGNFVITSK